MGAVRAARARLPRGRRRWPGRPQRPVTVGLRRPRPLGRHMPVSPAPEAAIAPCRRALDRAAAAAAAAFPVAAVVAGASLEAEAQGTAEAVAALVAGTANPVQSETRRPAGVQTLTGLLYLARTFSRAVRKEPDRPGVAHHIRFANSTFPPLRSTTCNAASPTSPVNRGICSQSATM